MGVYAANDLASLLKLKRYIDEIQEAGKSCQPVTVVSSVLNDRKSLGPMPTLDGETAEQFVGREWGFNWQKCSVENIDEVHDIFITLLSQWQSKTESKRRPRVGQRLSSLVALTKKKM